MTRQEDSPTAVPSGIHVTFHSLLSYGNTENSSTSLADDGYAHGLLGGTYRPPSRRWPRSPSSSVRNVAGGLFRSGVLEDHWVLSHVLGSGACSVVRLAESRQDDTKAAVKIVSKGAPDLFCPNTGYCRELSAFAILHKHPNIVDCYQVYHDDRFIYIVIELLSGGQILPRLADSSHYYPNYCENDLVTLVRAVVNALVALHALGIAHRDIKPENILYVSDSKDPSVKLTDFGIAHVDTHKSNANDMVGTPLYVAPEVLLRKPYGCAADMWSLGVIVHILLTGYPPFDDDDLVNLVNKVKHSTVRLVGEEWGHVSDAARNFTAALLNRNVSARLTAKQALAHPWLNTPRPPPFPAPPMPQHSLKPPCKPKSQSVTSNVLDGTTHLVTAQTNLQSFVRRKEWKRRESEKSDRNVKLSMLVSLSEKDLKISESAKVLDSFEPSVTREALAVLNSENNDAFSFADMAGTKKKDSDCTASSSFPPPRSSKLDPTESSTVTREDVDLEHQQEQERLRQHRLRIQAKLSNVKEMKTVRADHCSDTSASDSEDSLSSTTSVSSNRDGETDQHNLMLSISKFSDDSMLLDSFPSRRDADAQEDADAFQKQRSEGDGNIPKHRTSLLGRHSRRSSNSKEQAKAERPKGSRGKAIRILRRQKHGQSSSG